MREPQELVLVGLPSQPPRPCPGSGTDPLLLDVLKQVRKFSIPTPQIGPFERRLFDGLTEIYEIYTELVVPLV